MSNYRRLYQPGGTYFFTLVTRKRQAIFNSPENIQHLRIAFFSVMKRRPFKIMAAAVLPDHLHLILALPEGDSDYSTRIQLIKRSVSISMSRSVWQRRFWEHLVRGENDLWRHMDYIHYNPVKHGLVLAPVDWLYSSFHRAVRQGLYERDWGKREPDSIGSLKCGE